MLMAMGMRRNPCGKRGGAEAKHSDPRLIPAGVCLGLYVLTYLVFSPFGAYAPSILGLNGPKFYHWAPPGFYDPVREKWIHPELRIFYAPLDMIDHRIWHNHRFPEATDPSYPVPTPAPRKVRLGTEEEPE